MKKLTKKYIKSGAPIKCSTITSEASIWWYQQEYGLTAEEACLFAIQKEQEVIDMDLIHNRVMKDFRCFLVGFEYRIIIDY
jgi:hypothetical protein